MDYNSIFDKPVNNLENLMRENGYTLKKVSEETNIPITTLSGYKKNSRTPKKENAKILADYFGVSVAYLMGLKVEDFKKPITDSVAATETISQLRDIHEKRKRLLKELRELSDLEAELLLAFNKS